jgi:hypothetical protein
MVMAKPKKAANAPAKSFTDPDHIYTQLKICLSKITGFSIDQIFTTDNLATKYHFTPRGQRVLAQNLEACFAQAGSPIPKQLDRDKMQAAATVGDVADILNAAFGVWSVSTFLRSRLLQQSRSQPFPHLRFASARRPTVDRAGFRTLSKRCRILAIMHDAPARPI